jgi:hypothetical protein
LALSCSGRASGKDNLSLGFSRPVAPSKRVLPGKNFRVRAILAVI